MVRRFDGFGVGAFTVIQVTVLMSLTYRPAAQEAVSTEERARADAAVRSAFASLYALPKDTAGAPMGSWVLDSAGTARSGDPSGRWRIVVTKLTDTGRDLPLSELLRNHDASPAQLAASVAAVQRLEGRISRAEADAALEVTVRVNDAGPVTAGLPDNAPRMELSIARARAATRAAGQWVRVTDRDLDLEYERWIPATLVVAFDDAGAGTAPAIHRVTITARGSDEMIDKLLRETNWESLASLVSRKP